ncbi:M3 family metallopeptidase [Avrilella dinanensis]|uniref:Peptidase M3 n=1 Tax=Avrilella dinanensis TaxID=2008672 RepID=A0A2M9R711_9FLAO|nr:M3 family metallopeptidase [Avrilella dinanensis]PJR04652.1 peptidase M3 [Avrilella dinanensis]
MQNILLTTFDEAPFSKINNSDFEPAFDEAIKLAKTEIEEITVNTESPTFENTLERLSFSGMQLDRISSVFFNLHSAETNDEIQQIAQKTAPKLSAFNNDIILNEKLFERIKNVYEQREKLNLTAEQQTLLKKTYRNFVRNGALLNETDKQKLREIDAELAVESLKFAENVLTETQAYRLHITDEKQLKGLPEGALEAAEQLARAESKDGWLFTLDYPSYLPFVTYAENRELREKIVCANGRKAFQQNQHNNEKIVLKIVQLRHQRANLLGYKTHADFVLEERMAENPENVQRFLNELLEKSKPAAEKELKELTDFAQQTDGISQLQKWDSSYYAEKLKKQKFQLDDELLKPYFELNNVLNGAFEVARRLYGITFKQVNNVDVYHSEVQTYRVYDEDGSYLALFYTDFFPRKGKRNGAWMTSFKSQYTKNGINERPHVSIVCNFTRPTTTKPSLLTFNEVTTLFHEFGHALHGMLADTVYPSLSGTSVYWDFVELPSQIMENWCYEEEALKLFAKHYQTEEIIPMEYVNKIKESANFLEGLATVRQLSFGLLDMGWHAQNPSEISDLKTFENRQFASTQMYPDVKDNAMSPSFSHIFNGGYSAGYYSYKWAEVLDADAFAFFKENGIFDRQTGQLFRDHILSKGGTENPMELYKRFRGQEPNPEALLERAGLV